MPKGLFSSITIKVLRNYQFKMHFYFPNPSKMSNLNTTSICFNEIWFNQI